jgi:phosphoglycolate phosphatase-like HAD superfamily hydrolase
MSYAAELVFGQSTALSLNGRTDAWIIAQYAAGHELAGDPDALTRFRLAYLDRLGREIEQPGPRGGVKGVMPGVRQLLDVLSEQNDVILGLLTGNLEPGARLKLEHFDLWKYFSAGAFGGETVDRNSLFGVALDRIAEVHGARFDPSSVVIVGDTPFDVAVARAGGARSVAVATGSHDAVTLAASGADVVLEDLSDLDASLAAFGL